MTRATAIFLLTLLLPATVAAQETVELSDTQRGFNEKGVNAIRAGEYELAISSFESSLNVGQPANIIHLNLGRAYQRAGNCLKAKEHYGKVADAPAVSAPSRDEILGVLAKYSGELPEQCPATVKVRCDDAATTIAVDGGPAKSCGDAASLALPPGDHRLVATLGGRTVQRDVSPAEGEVVEVTIAFPEETQPDPNPDPNANTNTTPDPGLVAEAPPKKSSPLRMVGLVTGAVGAAGITVGLLNDALWVRPRLKDCTEVSKYSFSCENPDDFSRAQNAQRANTVILSVGGGLAVAGLILYIAGGSSDNGVGLQFDGGPGIAWTTRF